MAGKLGCENCGKCVVIGYNPRKYINTISYWCEAKSKYVTPSKTDCPYWTEGDPWERAKQKWNDTTKN